MDIKAPLPRILVYQDEDCSVLVEYLVFRGFTVINTTERDAMPKMREDNYDLCILGHFKANVPGDLRLLRYIRNRDKNMPVIFLSDLSDYSYIIEAFNSGADDYVTRPYNLEELICRIKALFKRCKIKIKKIEPVYEIGDFTFYTEKKMLKIGSTEIKLSAKENRVLSLLCAYKDELLPYNIILSDIWGECNEFNKRNLNVVVCSIRNHLKKDSRIVINSKTRSGYYFVIEGKEDE